MVNWRVPVERQYYAIERHIDSNSIDDLCNTFLAIESTNNLIRDFCNDYLHDNIVNHSSIKQLNILYHNITDYLNEMEHNYDYYKDIIVYHLGYLALAQEALVIILKIIHKGEKGNGKNRKM